MDVRIFVAAVMASVITASFLINIYLFYSGYYPRAEGPAVEKLSSTSTVYEIKRPLFPLIVNTTEGVVRVPVEGRINVFVPQYVNCPDICHIETLIMLYVMEKTVEAGISDRIVWVTVEVDPWRSEPGIVARYMRDMAGDLYGKVDWIWILEKGDKLEKIWKQLGIVAQRDDKTGLIGHTAGFYIADENGTLLYYIKPKSTVLENAWENPKDIGDGLWELLKHLAKSEE
ncbi:MAG: SCO family protein [Desulfurococcales archaeon]|nr:SCO family protein [Desulfurococcales archaeon]